MRYRTDYIAPIGPEGLHIVNTGDWRNAKPILDSSSCVKCGICLMYCPVNSIRLTDGAYHIDYSYCKGCGICVHECRTRSIVMTREG